MHGAIPSQGRVEFLEGAVQEKIQSMAQICGSQFRLLGAEHLIVCRNFQVSFRIRHCASVHLLSMPSLRAFAQI
jgi:hypothetical protein